MKSSQSIFSLFYTQKLFLVQTFTNHFCALLNFPKPYSKAEARMLAHDDKNPEVTDDENSGDEDKQGEKKQTLPSIKGAKPLKDLPAKLVEA